MGKLAQLTPRPRKALQRISLVFTPSMRDGIAVIAFFTVLLGGLVLCHVMAERMATQAQVQNLAKKGRR